MAGAHDIQTSQDERFVSLIERSIASWTHLHLAEGVAGSCDSLPALQQLHVPLLRGLRSLDDFLSTQLGCTYFFFQTRRAFFEQTRFQKWDPAHLDRYILLPASVSYVNRQDCFFVSHYWHDQDDPDPDGHDLKEIQGDLAAHEWSYVWIDYTCLPQAQRTASEATYFKNTIHWMSLLIRNCAFEWRYPSFKPRLWIFFEIVEYHLSCKETFFATQPDMEHFWAHLHIMLDADDVRGVLDTFGYGCRKQEDRKRIISRIEILIILYKILPDDLVQRRRILDHLDNKSSNNFYNPIMHISRTHGFVDCNGTRYRFTPVAFE